MAVMRDIGDVVRVEATFLNIAGALADPTTVTALVLAPDGTQTDSSAEVVNDSVGEYHLDVTSTAAGRWRARIEGDAPAPGVEETDWRVRRTVFDLS